MHSGPERCLDGCGGAAYRGVAIAHARETGYRFGQATGARGASHQAGVNDGE